MKRRWDSFKQFCSGMWAKAGWAGKLFIAGSICALISICGLYYTETVQKSRENATLERQFNESLNNRLEDAWQAWTIQQTLLEGREAGLESGKNVKPRSRGEFEQEVRNRVGPPQISKSGRVPSLPRYVAVEGTQLRTKLLSFLGQGSVALLVISILLFLAMFIVPFFKNFFDISQNVAKGKVEKTFNAEDKRESPQPDGKATNPMPVTFGGSPPQSSQGTAAAGGALGFLSSFRTTLAPTVMAAGAVLAIGAIWINVSGREATISPDVRLPNVGLDIGNFSIGVKPGHVDVPPSRVFPTMPSVQANIPPLAFYFPAERVEQEALTALTKELGEYRLTLHEFAAQNKRLADWEHEISELKAQNAVLQEKLEDRPTQEQVKDLLKKLEEQNQLAAASKEVLASLQAPLKDLANAAVNQQYGDRLAARQRASELTAQIESKVNQRFFPKLVQRNCSTYNAMRKELPDLPELPACLESDTPPPKVKTANAKVGAED